VTAVREAVVLPALFLTVTLAAMIEPGARTVVSGASLFSLVLGVMLFAALIRCGALDPARLLHASRGMLANANGFAVVVTLFAASSQVLWMLSPRSGLPMFFVGVLLFVQLLNTLVSSPDRVRLLRSIAVTLGSALVLKFVVLGALSAPGGSRTARVLTALFDAATFGSITQAPQDPAGGYIAFGAVALYLAGIALLPGRSAVSPRTELVPR